MSRRVVLGRYVDGVHYGLRISLPGYDALTDDSGDARKFSFDSEWADLVKVHMVGIGTVPDFPANIVVSFADLGYKPFFEVRRRSGVIVFDDSFSSTKVGIAAEIRSNQMILPHSYSGVSSNPGIGAYEVAYVVYRVAASTG